MIAGDACRIDEFYSSDDIELWKAALGPKLHYHLGTKTDVNDIFDQSVFDIYDEIGFNTKVLDCGCGWGGPANLLIRDLNSDVTGITISKAQHDYLNQANKFPVYLADLHQFIPKEKYSCALFFESFTHLTRPDLVLRNLRTRVDKIVLRDFSHSMDLYNPDWKMHLRSVNTFVRLFEDNGYQISKLWFPKTDALKTFQFYRNNLQKIKNKIQGQLQLLLELAETVCSQTKENQEDIKVIGIDKEGMRMINIVANVKKDSKNG